MTTNGSRHQKPVPSWGNSAFYPQKKYNKMSGLLFVLYCDEIMSLLFRGAEKRYPDDATDHRSASTYLHLTYTRPLQLGLEVCIWTCSKRSNGSEMES